MGTATVITSDALTDLEDDVTELTTKLNGVIAEYNKVQADMTTNLVAINALKTQFNFAESDLTDHKNKINTLITEVEDINDKISDGYTPATSGSNHGTSGDSILLRLERLDTDFVNLDNRLQGHMAGNYTSTQVHNVGSPGSGRTGGSSDNLNGITALGTPTTGTAADNSSAITAVTNDDSTSTATASVTPSYTAGATKVITIGAKGEIRGKRLARQTLNRLRK